VLCNDRDAAWKRVGIRVPTLGAELAETLRCLQQEGFKGICSLLPPPFLGSPQRH